MNHDRVFITTLAAVLVVCFGAPKAASGQLVTSQYTVTAVAGSIVPLGTPECTGLVAQTTDPYGPFQAQAQSVYYDGSHAASGSEVLHLIYRYRIDFNQTVTVASVDAQGAGDYISGGTGAALRLLDGNQNPLAILSTSNLGPAFTGGGCHLNPIYTLNANGIAGTTGTTFFIDEFDYSTNGAYRDLIRINFTPTACQLNPGDVKTFTGTPFSRDGKPLSMNATFAPTDANGAPVALADEETTCGFTGFNWQQEIVSLPSPSPYFPVNQGDAAAANIAVDGSLLAPPRFLDPLPEGYKVEDPTGLFIPEYTNANPYYYTASDLTNSSLNCNLGQTIPIQTTNVLEFQDCPGDYALHNGAAIQFQTSLVGVCGSGAKAAACNGLPVDYPSPPIFTWNWQSTFNGLGKRQPQTGIGGVSQLKSFFPLDPNSGTGGVTITAINGTSQNPPSITCTATLHRTKEKPSSVTVSGTLTPGTSPIPSNGTTYSVAIIGHPIQTGSFTIGAGGIYSFQIPASRLWDDGVKLNILVTATDSIGNVGTCSTTIAVPDE